MKKYNQYKSTDIEWIDSIPIHWKAIPLKYQTQFINGAAFKPSDWTDIGIPIIKNRKSKWRE